MTASFFKLLALKPLSDLQSYNSLNRQDRRLIAQRYDTHVDFSYSEISHLSTL